MFQAKIFANLRKSTPSILRPSISLFTRQLGIIMLLLCKPLGNNIHNSHALKKIETRSYAKLGLFIATGIAAYATQSKEAFALTEVQFIIIPY
jgi:hypothetical protein